MFKRVGTWVSFRANEVLEHISRRGSAQVDPTNSSSSFEPGLCKEALGAGCCRLGGTLPSYLAWFSTGDYGVLGLRVAANLRCCLCVPAFAVLDCKATRACLVCSGSMRFLSMELVQLSRDIILHVIKMTTVLASIGGSEVSRAYCGYDRDHGHCIRAYHLLHCLYRSLFARSPNHHHADERHPRGHQLHHYISLS